MMQFLIDKVASDVERKHRDSDLIAGQLLTPISRYKNWGGVFAIDNGAFSGFNPRAFKSLIQRNEEHREKCLFVVVPDVVANGRRTCELFRQRHQWIPSGWPVAFVAQDGVEEMEIPWNELDCLFVGGGDPWKDSIASQDVVRTAKALGKHVHIGRVNTSRRFELWAELGADTCDGTGIAKYDHMLESLSAHLQSRESQTALFDSSSVCNTEDTE